MRLPTQNLYQEYKAGGDGVKVDFPAPRLPAKNGIGYQRSYGVY